MITYMLRFNRATGSLDELQEFPSVDAAVAAYEKAELEDLHSGDDIEIGILNARDIDDLKKRWPRYFTKEAV